MVRVRYTQYLCGRRKMSWGSYSGIAQRWPSHWLWGIPERAGADAILDMRHQIYIPSEALLEAANDQFGRPRDQC